MDENQVQSNQQVQQTQVSNPQQSQPVTDQSAQNGQNFFWGDQGFNYDESSAFEAVDGKVEEENYDFQDFSPFDADEEAIDDALVGDEEGEEVKNQNDGEVFQEKQQMSPEEEMNTSFSNDSIETEEDNDGNKNPEILEKFSNVYGLTKKILSISEDNTSFSFSGGETVNSKIEYQIYLIEDEEDHTDLFFKKIETKQETGDEEEHLIQWTYNKTKDKLDVFVDEVILYEIGNGHTEEEKWENMIIEKLNKFASFFEWYYNDLYKKVQKQKEIEEKNRLLHEIFKNF